MTTPIKVEQVDREAAIEQLSGMSAYWCTEMREGRSDGNPVVQSYARHRIAAEAKAFEEAARIAEGFSERGKHWLTQRVANDIATAIRSRMETDND
jgi:adenosyl cobinamide kinase/adenosyl cobinamide phosphate guanylyltransferase